MIGLHVALTVAKIMAEFSFGIGGEPSTDSSMFVPTTLYYQDEAFPIPLPAFPLPNDPLWGYWPEEAIRRISVRKAAVKWNENVLAKIHEGELALMRANQARPPEPNRFDVNRDGKVDSQDFFDLLNEINRTQQ